MTARRWHPRYGAHPIGAGQISFKLWAPSCDAVALEIEGSALIPMRRESSGDFSAVASCAIGARYRYRVRPDLAVADPASRLQDGDANAASIVVDPTDFPWQETKWLGRPWHETVLYELHPGICGGFSGIAAMLPGLAELGISAIELMPIADFPGTTNWGYDGVLPYAPDTAYGTLGDLRQMIDTAHRLGVMVFLDVVYNHFGPDQNYLHTYAAEFFRDDIVTPWGAAIDFRREQVRRFYIDNAIMWLLDYRIDGLRFDAVHAIEGDDFLWQMAREVRAAIPVERHVHLVLENDDNETKFLTGAAGGGYDAQWSDDAHHCLHVLLTGEQGGYYEDYPQPAAQLARCLAEGFAYQGEASKHRDGRHRGSNSAALPPSAFVMFLQNHDQIGNRALGERLSILADPDALRAAVLVLLLSPQIPLLFMGEERGSTAPFLYFTDHRDPELAEAVRTGRRREFAKFPEFAAPAARARIPDPNDPATFTASIPHGHPAGSSADAWRSYYRDLLRRRHAEIIPRIIGATSRGAAALGEKSLRAAWHLGDGAMLTIAANFGAIPVQYGPVTGQVLAASAGEGVDDFLPPRTSIAWLDTASQP